MRDRNKYYEAPDWRDCTYKAVRHKYSKAEQPKTHLINGQEFVRDGEFCLNYNNDQLLAISYAMLNLSGFPIDGVAFPEISDEVMWGFIRGWEAAHILGIARKEVTPEDAYKIVTSSCWGYDTYAIVLCHIQGYKILDEFNDKNKIIKYPYEWIASAGFVYARWGKKLHPNILTSCIQNDRLERLKRYDRQHWWFPGVYYYDTYTYCHYEYGKEVFKKLEHWELLKNVSTEPFIKMDTDMDKIFVYTFRNCHLRMPFEEMLDYGHNLLKGQIKKKTADESEREALYDSLVGELDERLEKVKDYHAFADPKSYLPFWFEHNYGLGLKCCNLSHEERRDISCMNLCGRGHHCNVAYDYIRDAGGEEAHNAICGSPQFAYRVLNYMHKHLLKKYDFRDCPITVLG